MKNIENSDSNQIKLNFNQPEKKEEKDSKGRTRADIIKESRSLNQKIIDNIFFKDGEYYIEGKLADDWISIYNKLDEKDSDYVKGQW